MSRNLSDIYPPIDTAAKMGGDNFLHVQDQKTQNTHGGDFTSGAWRTRDLNTVLTNTIPGASLASNQITLPAGKYYAEVILTNYSSTDMGTIQAKIYDATGLADIAVGLSARVNFLASGTAASFASSMATLFDLSEESDIEVQQRCQNTMSLGFGFAANLTTEVYSDIRIWRIGEYVAP